MITEGIGEVFRVCFWLVRWIMARHGLKAASGDWPTMTKNLRDLRDLRASISYLLFLWCQFAVKGCSYSSCADTKRITSGALQFEDHDGEMENPRSRTEFQRVVESIVNIDFITPGLSLRLAN